MTHYALYLINLNPVTIYNSIINNVISDVKNRLHCFYKSTIFLLNNKIFFSIEINIKIAHDIFQ